MVDDAVCYITSPRLPYLDLRKMTPDDFICIVAEVHRLFGEN